MVSCFLQFFSSSCFYKYMTQTDLILLLPSQKPIVLPWSNWITAKIVPSCLMVFSICNTLWANLLHDCVRCPINHSWSRPYTFSNSPSKLAVRYHSLLIGCSSVFKPVNTSHLTYFVLDCHMVQAKGLKVMAEGDTTRSPYWCGMKTKIWKKNFVKNYENQTFLK